MKEKDHPDYVDSVKAKDSVDSDIKKHGEVPTNLPVNADPITDVPAADHNKGKPDWVAAGLKNPKHWTQVGDTWVHDTEN